MKRLILICLSFISLFDLNGQIDLYPKNLKTYDTIPMNGSLSYTYSTVEYYNNNPLKLDTSIYKFVNAIFISKDTILDSLDYELSNKNGKPIKSFGSVIDTFFSKANTYTSKGSWNSSIIPSNYIGNNYLIYFMDFKNQIQETNESNNIIVKPLYIIPQADIYASVISYPKLLKYNTPNLTAPLQIKIINKGAIKSSKININVSLNDYAKVFIDDTIDSLDVNDSIIVSYDRIVVDSFIPSFPNHSVTIDVNTSNQLSGRSTKVIVSGIEIISMADIAFFDIDMPKNVTIDSMYNFSFKVNNKGIIKKNIDTLYFYQQIVHPGGNKCCTSYSLYRISSPILAKLSLNSDDTFVVSSSTKFYNFYGYKQTTYGSSKIYLGTKDAKYIDILSENSTIHASRYDLVQIKVSADLYVTTTSTTKYYDSNNYRSPLEFEVTLINNSNKTVYDIAASGTIRDNYLFFSSQDYQPIVTYSSNVKYTNTYVSGTYQQRMTMDSLKPNEAVTVKYNYNFPIYNPNYGFLKDIFFVAAIGSDLIEDTNTKNNTDTVRMTLRATDFELKSAIFETKIVPKKSFANVKIEILNSYAKDNINSGLIRIRLFNNDGYSINSQDIYSFSAIPGQITPNYYSFAIPNNIPEGKYYLSAEIDPFDFVLELNKLNNGFQKIDSFLITTVIPPKRDKTKALKSSTPIYSYTTKQNTIEALIYPNPTKDILNIDLKDWDNQAITLNIYNTLGVLAKQVILDENHDNIQQLDIATLQNGNYYMFIENGEERSDALKFVKAE
jgi:hypothetical protein